MHLSYLDKNILIRLSVLIFADIILWWYCLSGTNFYMAFHHLPFQIALIFGLLITGGLTFIELGKFMRGFNGEVDIKVILSRLPSEYHRFYDLNLVNRGNIDAVVVGPSGIWTIEVKSHKGKITFENDHLLIKGHQPEKDFLKQTYAESMALKDLLIGKLGYDIKVNPVLAFSSNKAYLKFGLHPQKGVYVIGGRWLTRLLNEQGDIMNKDQINKVVSVIVNRVNGL